MQWRSYVQLTNIKQKQCSILMLIEHSCWQYNFKRRRQAAVSVHGLAWFSR